ncbi:MAG: hypothetical protein AABW79_03120 [Nanoarchaeota archaeon]
MVEKDNIIKEKVKYSGLMSFKDAYKFARELLDKEGYSVTEDSYSEKVSGNSKEIEISWVATKKLSDYYKSALKIKWRVLGMTDVEVEVDGKRKNMNKVADLSIEVSGVLEKDYDNKWEGSSMQKFFKEVYNKYVVVERTHEKEGKVSDDVQDFKEEIKAYLELTGRIS